MATAGAPLASIANVPAASGCTVTVSDPTRRRTPSPSRRTPVTRVAAARRAFAGRLGFGSGWAGRNGSRSSGSKPRTATSGA
ncbi:MAG TPA: hypothetical protein VF549_09035 [Solirubrobacteraceae bacterium]